LKPLFPFCLKNISLFAPSILATQSRSQFQSTCAMSSMLVRDLRLAGQTPTNLADNNYEVDDSVTIPARAWLD
jgi:hypothetical protein